MNPEIRFRVSLDIYGLAEHRAQELGLSGAEAGRSAGVPLLARAALYHWLGLAWPEDLPRPQMSLAPSGLSLSHTGLAELTVHHALSEAYRRECLEKKGQGLALTTTTVLQLEPAKLPRLLRRCLRLDDKGGLSGMLHLPELESDGPLTVEALCQFLTSRATLPTPQSAQDWEHTLASWAQAEGSELLRARIEEGFSWLALAESEWIRWQIHQAVGDPLDLEALRAEQSLAGEDWIHTLVPDREPSLERIQLLRAMRAKVSDLGIRLTLVRGARSHIGTRSRTAGEPFAALLWQMDTPSGGQLGLLSHHSS